MMTTKNNKPSVIARFVVYPLVGICFVFIAALVLLFANGYWIKLDNGKIELQKTGMLIVASRPGGGKIYLDDKNINSSTGFYLLPNKIANLLPGIVNVKVARFGYRTWENNLRINPSLVTWANYILLFPTKLTIKQVPVPSGKYLGESLDGRQLLLSQQTPAVSVVTVDTNNNNARIFWPKDTTNYSAWIKNPTFRSGSFNSSNDRIVYGMQNGSATNYVVTEGNGDSTKLVDISEKYNIAINVVEWSLFDSNELYVLSGGNLYVVNPSVANLPEPIAKNVVSFTQNKNGQIYFVTKNLPSKYTLERMNRDGGSKQMVLEPIAEGGSYTVLHSNQLDAVSLQNTTTGEMLLIYDSVEGKTTTLKLASGIIGSEWAKNSPKLLYYSATKIYRYDFEKRREVEFDAKSKIISVKWFFDDSHFLVNTDTNSYVVDFDGTNMVEIQNGNKMTILDDQNFNILFGPMETGGKLNKYLAEF